MRDNYDAKQRSQRDECTFLNQQTNLKKRPLSSSKEEVYESSGRKKRPLVQESQSQV